MIQIVRGAFVVCASLIVLVVTMLLGVEGMGTRWPPKLWPLTCVAAYAVILGMTSYEDAHVGREEGQPRKWSHMVRVYRCTWASLGLWTLWASCQAAGIWTTPPFVLSVMLGSVLFTHFVEWWLFIGAVHEAVVAHASDYVSL